MSGSELLSIGKLYSDRADFAPAVSYLNRAADAFHEDKDLASYLKCQNILLRIYAEKEQLDLVQQTKEKLQDLVLREGFELNSKTYYTLALCASYRGQYDSALEYIQKALTLAIASDNKEDICYAISGLVATYMGLRRFEDALKEVYNLQVFFQVLSIADIRISAQMNNAIILAELGRYEQALDILWQTYEMVREEKSLLLHVHLLTCLGWVYSMAGEKDMARVYLQLAKQTCDSTNLVYRHKFILNELDKIGAAGSSQFDLVFDWENHTVVEKKLGRVDFKNQFILLDLLRLFVQSQGKVYSKEFLVEHVWKQAYDPAVHDNKIYVTIKRLRKMIEPDFDKPKYIFRAKNGYFMNKSAKVHIDNGGISET